jgi:hypothetical protein
MTEKRSARRCLDYPLEMRENHNNADTNAKRKNKNRAGLEKLDRCISGEAAL